MMTLLANSATGSLAVASCLLAANLASLAHGAQPLASRFRPIGREEYEAARAARNRAEQLRGEYRKRFRCPVSRTPEETEFFWQAVAAYREAVALSAGSEMGAYCHRGLIGLFKRRGHFRKACELAQEMSRFKGTKYEAEAYMALAGVHADGFKDALGASRWLRRIGPPAGASVEAVVLAKAYNRDHGDYLAAQLELAKCETRLGAPAEAEARWEKLRRKYPHLRTYVDSIREVHLRNAGSPTLRRELMAVVDNRIREDVSFLLPISAEGTVTGPRMQE